VGAETFGNNEFVHAMLYTHSNELFFYALAHRCKQNGVRKPFRLMPSNGQFAKIKYRMAWLWKPLEIMNWIHTLNQVHLPFYLFPDYPDHDNPELANIFIVWKSLRKTLNIVGRVGIGGRGRAWA
jgi:hypothetical protein